MARLDLGATEFSAMASRPAGPDILLKLGLDCASGRDGIADLVAAHKWFNLAAMKGSRDAVRYRREISEEMSRAEIADAQRAAREWLSLH